MKNNEKYKNAFNGVKPSQEAEDRFKALAAEEKEEKIIHKVKFTKTRTFRTAVALAACFAIVFGIFAFVGKDRLFVKPVIDEPGTAEKAALPEGLAVFKSEKELKAFIKKATKDYGEADGDLNYGIRKSSSAPTMAVPNSVDGATGAVATEESYSFTSDMSAETYTQEKGVDEADIIKTYGDLIFVAHSVYEDYRYYGGSPKNVVDIYRVKDGKETRIATVEVFADAENVYLRDIYVTENRLIVNGSGSNYIFYDTIAYGVAEKNSAGTDDKKESEEDNTVKMITEIYDIGNIEEPKLMKTFRQNGSYSSSRMIGSKLYLISSYTVYDFDGKSENVLPSVYSDDEKEPLDPENIAYIPERGGNNYIVASVIDTDECKRHGEPKAMIGNGYEIYCSTENLYVYSENWDGWYSRGNTTEITKISLGDEITFTAHEKISGRVDDQYAFCEKGGNLFVCLTVTGKDDKESNVLRVLDKDLKETAKTDYFATGESIKAVKYIGDFAYVITYEQTDPLFVIDIADPAEPKVLGHALISGFSTMLVDIGDNMLLGIGYCTGEYDYIDMEVTDGIKVALFDISDPLKPKVLDSREYKSLWSPVQENPKAFIQNLQKGYYAIPYSDEYEDTNVGALVFSVENGKLKEEINFSQARGDLDDFYSNHTFNGPRLTFVGDWYYIIDNDLSFASFEMK